MNFIKKIIKNLPIIKQINNRHWTIINKLDNTNDIINSIHNENIAILNENRNILNENRNVLNENTIILNENKDLLEYLKNLNNEVTGKINVLLKVINKYNIEDELAILCDLYGSNKGSIFRKVHTYSKVYNELFSPIRNNVKAVLECGVGKINPVIPDNLFINPSSGASLRIWRDYFINAIIIGGDINYEALFDETRIHTGFLDQTSQLVIDRFFNYFALKHTDSFDIIIDNGLKKAEAAICLLENSFKYLKKGGYYIIEDMHTVKDIPILKQYLERCSFKKEFAVRYEYLDKVLSENNNNLVIIKKRKLSND